MVLKKVSRVTGSGGRWSCGCWSAGLALRGARALGAEPPACSFPRSQDVDAAYMGRTDLHGKVGTLAEELDFLNHLYEMVRRPVERVVTYGIPTEV